MPFFIVDDAFHDSKEVMSIPARYRHEAIGLWVRCGAWSAQKMTDGVVPTQVVMDYVYYRKGWKAWVEKLVAATLWEWSEGDDYIRFRNWERWQQTKAQVVARKGADAARKRRSRARQQTFQADHTDATATRQRLDTDSTPTRHRLDTDHENTSTSDDTEMSQRTSRARAPRQYQRDKPMVTTSGIAKVSKGEPPPPDEAIAARSATPGSELVRRHIPDDHPAAVRTALRHRSSELINTGTDPNDVAAALRLWLAKPHLGPNALPALVSEVIRNRAAPATGPPNKMRTAAELAARMRAEELADPTRKELA